MPSTTRKSPAPLVRKAGSKDGELMAAYDQNGRLIGVVDPAKMTRVTDSNDGTTEKGEALPEPVRSAGTEQAAGETPQMGIRKRMVEVRKGLYGGGTAQQQNELAEHLNAAAICGLRIIHGRGAA